MEIKEKASRITDKRERVRFIYDSACARIDEYNAQHGIVCSFRDGRCEAAGDAGSPNGCCCGCIYQSSRGCPTSNMSCKLFFCEKMKEKGPLTFEDLPELQLLTGAQKYIVKNNVYCKRETFLKLLEMNSYVVFFIYSLRNCWNMWTAKRINRQSYKG